MGKERFCQYDRKGTTHSLLHVLMPSLVSLLSLFSLSLPLSPPLLPSSSLSSRSSLTSTCFLLAQLRSLRENENEQREIFLEVSKHLKIGTNIEKWYEVTNLAVKGVRREETREGGGGEKGGERGRERRE